MNKGIAFAGNLIVDYIKIIDTYPKQGMLTNIHEISRSVGGCAANTCIDAARLDQNLKTKVLGMVGDDSDGNLVKQVLTENRVDISGIKTAADGVPTSFTDVMNSPDTGERTFFHARGANAEFGIEDIAFDSIDADIFHIGYALLLDKFDAYDSEYGVVMARALKYANDCGMKTSMDVVSESGERFSRIVTPCLKYCDYIILNEVEAGLVAGIPVRDAEDKLLSENISKICNTFFDKGVKNKVVIHAPEAGWCMNAEGKLTCVPSLLLPKDYIKGTVGAGDAFCAGMLYSIYMGYDDEYALRLASCAAGCNLSAPGSVGGARDVNKTMELEKLFARRQIP